jgi:hypothetical protein
MARDVECGLPFAPSTNTYLSIVTSATAARALLFPYGGNVATSNKQIVLEVLRRSFVERDPTGRRLFPVGGPMERAGRSSQTGVTIGRSGNG